MIEKIFISKQAFKELERIDEKNRFLIKEAILSLKDNNRSANLKKIKNSDNFFRLKVGHFRVIFVKFKKEKSIKITHIRLRNESTYKQF